METLLHVGLSNALMATVLAGLACAVGRCCRRPALVHGLWLLVLLKLVTPPLYRVPLPFLLPEGTTSVAEQQTSPKEIAPPINPFPTTDREDFCPECAGLMSLPTVVETHVPAIPATTVPVEAPDSGVPISSCCTMDVALLVEEWWQPALACLWLSGTIVWLAVAGYRIERFQRLLRFAKPAPDKVERQAQELAGRLGLARCPSVWLVPGRVSPMLWAMGGPPRLLLPAELLQRLPEEEWLTLLAHELAHCKRRDHWVRGLELVATGLYWWHPVLWWARRELRDVEEVCCDAWVVWALPAAARAYARALVETVDFLSESRLALPPAASGIGHIHMLKRRLTMILRGSTPRALSAGGLIVVLGLGALLLPLWPTWAQDRPRREEPPRERSKELQRDRQGGEEAEKLRQEIGKVREHLEKMRQQMEESHRHLQHMQRRLAELEGQGRPQDPRGGEREGQRPPFPGGPPQGHAQDLERRLEAIMKELEVLRFEIRQQRFGDHRPDGPPPDGDRLPPKGERKLTPPFPPGPPTGERKLTPPFPPGPPTGERKPIKDQDRKPIKDQERPPRDDN